MAFQKAVKQQLKAKICLDGPAGAGKTFSALRMAAGIARASGVKIALIDTENKSSNLYANRFEFDNDFIFPPYTPEAYIAKIKEAEAAGYGVIIIDSMSHEWNGPGGCLEIVDKLSQANRGKNNFTAWGDVGPRHNAFINTIIHSPVHVITTVRSKMGYEMGKDDNGKPIVTKLGLQPVTRDGFEFENTIVFNVSDNNFARASKDRTSLFVGQFFQITEETGEKIYAWLEDGEPVPTPESIIEIIDGANTLSQLAEVWKDLTPRIRALSPNYREIVQRTKALAKARLSLPQPATPKPEEVTSNEPV